MNLNSFWLIEYNSRQQKTNCSRRCGNVSVPFPFGIEKGCSARKSFQLNCLDTTPPVLRLESGIIDVTYINASEGILGIKYDSSIGEDFFNMMLKTQPTDDQEPNLYVDPLESASVRWAVDNLRASPTAALRAGALYFFAASELRFCAPAAPVLL